MRDFKYNPHNQFKAIVYLTEFIKNKELSEQVKNQISSYYKEHRKTNPPKTKYQTQNHLYMKANEYC